ncbi:hypothetical protein GCM10027271_31260 [Saccharopolyspora gloriosae]|uniref:Excreted virulence factor EspC (Type VII ESX diderm) n=1 Tax=Saccharopolyspora gloriosae TaxID=455344 RepID=A0A840NEE2_9PSEU|nr:hypothetical protein [Saccharopolyspora gloriosae]MBB5069974.1 hypothetical protein [Saccharopolyspora gloriosae]
MSGSEVDPAILDGLASKLRNASADMEGAATAPPEPQAGVVTGAIMGALAQLTEALGNVVTGAGAAGDSVAESRVVYVDTDYDQAAAFHAQELQAEQPR